MAKRFKANFSGGQQVFRISNPGYDVDTASQSQLAIDERIFYGQLIQSGYVAKPSGSSVVVPLVFNIGYPPLVLAYPLVNPSNSPSGTVFPSIFQFDTEWDSSQDRFGVTLRTTATTVTIEFPSKSTVGAYYQVYRSTWGV